MRCLGKKGIYYYFLPTYKQAKAVIWDSLIREHLPPEVVKKKNESELAIHYFNGSIQRFVGCEDIDKHRGINPIDAVFDEYSEMPEEIWTAIVQPVLRENNGTATFIFTPKGRNHSWKLTLKDDPEWYVTVRNNDETHTFSPEELEGMRREMPKDLFDQEVMCKFLEGAGAVFKNVSENIWEPTLLPNGIFNLGVDLAKYNDWTVITPFSVNEMRAYPQERFNQVDYTWQKNRIMEWYKKFSNATVIIDSTGVGEPIYDDLNYAGISIKPFHFTEKSRESLINNLRILLEQKKIKIPNDKGLIGELLSMTWELSDRGKVKMVVPNGVTDDRIMSLALSVRGILDKETYVEPKQPFSHPYAKDPDWQVKESGKRQGYAGYYSH